MIAVMIVPTGIGCAIGGHAGDATPAAKLLAACCDKLILHPNVVNASDINEMPDNALYVEGSILDRFLEGNIELKEVRQNKILLVVNASVRDETVNAVSAARATIGADIEILELDTPLKMKADMMDGRASGTISGWQELINQVRGLSFDALAIATPIECKKEVALKYFREGGVNPWGGVEAIASRRIAGAIYFPVAHAPIETDDPELKNLNELVDPRIAAEAISMCYLHCVLKGLHKSPRICLEGDNDGLSVRDVDVLVSPYNCWGIPHEACHRAGIPIIVVKENVPVVSGCFVGFNFPENYDDMVVENYLEAAGRLMCMQAGVLPESVRRPLAETKITRKEP